LNCETEKQVIAIRKLMYDRGGMVLFSSLLLVSLLMAAGMGALVLIQNDYRITANLRQGTAGFYFADAGIEWGKERIGQTAIHPPKPADRIQSFSSGTFSVWFVSSTPITPLSAKIIVRSTGASGTTAQTVQASVTKTYDLADGAIALRGEGASINFDGNSFLISGFDYDPSSGGPVSAAKPRSAITASSAALRAQIDTATLQTGKVIGGENNTAVSQSDFIPSDLMTRLGDDLCHAAGAATSVIPLGGTLSLKGQTWGSRSSPELHCIEGLAGPGDSVTVEGSFNGAGILVVRNAEFVANGPFRWEGLIIITGTDVGFRVIGEENKEVYGALMINETGPAPGSAHATLALEGAIKVLYSRPALNRVVDLLPAPTLENIYAALPFRITQDYWRSVNP
jgi:Tfp pilus assembly protein PilX